MLICKGDKAYKCNNITTRTFRGMQTIKFSIDESISQPEVVNLFDDNGFYFYDDIFDCRYADTNNTKMVGLCITYNADSTCNIKIKLTKGDVDNEG